MSSVAASNAAVLTVLGPVSPDSLGVTLIHEGLLSVVPGAQYAYDVQIDRAEIFSTLKQKLKEFKAAGGGTIVDSLGMFRGRDLSLYEALSRATGVNIIASTGMGPEEQLGGYFLTPQTNPPTPWPADKFAALFGQEATEGMVIPRLERRARAGLAVSTANRAGISATEVSLFKGVARTAIQTGLAASIRFGKDAIAELQEVMDEGLAPERIILGGVDRKDAVSAGVAQAVAKLGVNVALDSVGTNGDPELIDDQARVRLIADLVHSNLTERVLISAGAAGVSIGEPGLQTGYASVLTDFVPALQAAGVAQSAIDQILIHNPARLLAVAGANLPNEDEECRK